MPDAIYIDLLDTKIYARLLANPHQLVDFIPKNYQNWIVIIASEIGEDFDLNEALTRGLLPVILRYLSRNVGEEAIR